MFHALRVVALAAGLAAIGGCGSGPDDMPEVAPVRGKVTLNGKPLTDARVTFAPVDGTGQSSEGRTAASGEYVLTYKRDIMGAKLGKHKVYISTYEEPTTTDDGKTQGGFPEKVPAQYNENTTLEREVVDGENVFDFEL